MKLSTKLTTFAVLLGLVAALATSLAGSASASLVLGVRPPVTAGIATLPDLTASSDGTYLYLNNSGSIAAGPFWVTIGPQTGGTSCYGNGSARFQVGGLAGHSVLTINLWTSGAAYGSTSSAPRTVFVDSLNQVSESDENNNTAVIPGVPTIC